MTYHATEVSSRRLSGICPMLVPALYYNRFENAFPKLLVLHKHGFVSKALKVKIPLKVF